MTVSGNKASESFAFWRFFSSSASGREAQNQKGRGQRFLPFLALPKSTRRFFFGCFFHIDWSFTAPPTFFPGSRWLPRFYNPIRKGLQHELVHQKDKQRLLCPHGTHGKSPGRRPAVSPGRPVLLPHGQGGQHRGCEGRGVHPLRNEGDAGRHRPLGAGGQLSQPVQRRRQAAGGAGCSNRERAWRSRRSSAGRTLQNPPPFPGNRTRWLSWSQREK